MSTIILAVDEENRFQDVLETTLKGYDAKVITAKNTKEAKLIVLEKKPSMVICSYVFKNDPEGGVIFSKDLSTSESLAAIPVLLVASELNDGLIRKAIESGAKGLIPWPITVGFLKNRISQYLPNLVKELPQVPGSDKASERPGPQAKIKMPQGNLKVAQYILAQALYELRSSDIDAIQEEEIPDFVLKKVASVCGIDTKKYTS